MRFTVRLLVVLAVALTVRVGYVVAAKRQEPPKGDAIFYTLQAAQLAGGGGFTDPMTGRPAADHPPLTALSLVPAAWLSDNDLVAMRLTNCVIGTGAVAVIAFLVRRLAGPRVALTAAVVAALYPGLWINDGVLMAESLAALAVATVLFAAYRLHARPSLLGAVGLGLLVGVATLARSELALLWLFVVLPVLVVTPGVVTQRRLLWGAASLAAVALPIAPWAIYNTTRFDRPVLLSTNGGPTIAGANCDDTYFGRGIGFWSYDCATADLPAGDASTVSAGLRRRAIDYARHHVTRLPLVVAAREGRIWSVFKVRDMVSLNRGEGRERWASWLAFGSFWLLVPVGWIGWRRLRRRGAFTAPLTLLAAHVALVAAVFYGLVRFRVPFEVVLVVLAAVGLTTSERVPARATSP
jgi:4-amino-4-deoxy-L-arabinose transferase-like glycosyltransferase